MDETGDVQHGASAGDPAALHIALDAARADPAMREDARAVLREQARLSRIQADQLSEDGAFMRRSLRKSLVAIHSVRLSRGRRSLRTSPGKRSDAHVLNSREST